MCDYELATDTLCSQVGFALEMLPKNFSQRENLQKLQELIYHQNGSIRGKMAISAADLEWLNQWQKDLQSELYPQGDVPRAKELFVLPAGTAGASALHLARCQAKTVVRIMGQLKRDGVEVSKLLLEWANVVANMFFDLAKTANSESGRAEIPFVSKSY